MTEIKKSYQNRACSYALQLQELLSADKVEVDLTDLDRDNIRCQLQVFDRIVDGLGCSKSRKLFDLAKTIMWCCLPEKPSDKVAFPEIDWANAPEGSTHYRPDNHSWYQLTGQGWYYWATADVPEGSWQMTSMALEAHQIIPKPENVVCTAEPEWKIGDKGEVLDEENWWNECEVVGMHKGLPICYISRWKHPYFLANEPVQVGEEWFVDGEPVAVKYELRKPELTYEQKINRKVMSIMDDWDHIIDDDVAKDLAKDITNLITTGLGE